MMLRACGRAVSRPRRPSVITRAAGGAFVPGSVRRGNAQVWRGAAGPLATLVRAHATLCNTACNYAQSYKIAGATMLSSNPANRVATQATKLRPLATLSCWHGSCQVPYLHLASDGGLRTGAPGVGFPSEAWSCLQERMDGSPPSEARCDPFTCEASFSNPTCVISGLQFSLPQRGRLGTMRV